MTEKINTLTKEEENLMNVVSMEYEKNALSGNDTYDIDKIINGINFLYSLINLEKPEIIICNSPKEMAIDAELQPGETIDYLGCGYDSGWTAFYDFFQKIGVEYDKNIGFDTWKDFILNSGVFATVLYTTVAYVCIRPCTVKVNAAGDLHCIDGPAIAWRDGYAEYALNGIWMPREIVMTPAEKINPILALTETNADIQREIIRKIGAEKMLKASGAKLIDEADDPNTGLHYQLQEMVVSNIKRRYLYFQHATMPGIYYAKPVPIESQKALHARAWILSLIERDKLNNITPETEAELIANFPRVVS